MNNAVKTGLILTFGFLTGATLTLTQGVMADRTDSQVQHTLPLAELQNFTNIFAKIKADYVEKVDDKTLLTHAIRGMLSGLDPHSSYLDAQQYQELRIGTTGQFGGLGIQVGMDEDGFVKVISPIDDTPAFRAGMESGDLIIKLDDKPVKGMTLDEAVKLMRGEPGSDIVLTVVRSGKDAPFNVTITRDIIKVKSVKNRMLEADYGYVRISSFQSKTGSQLLDAIKKLTKENKKPLNGLVLDLRNNPGGVLHAAAEVSDLFLNKGKIVYTEGRIDNSYMEFNAKPGDVLSGVPLIVLINGGSASASEIVAGALQDHKRGIIVGSKSFGKGSVQTIQELPAGGAIKITTARYFTPSGRSIQAQGIEPDIKLDRVKITELKDNSIAAVKEADLSGHLANPKDSKQKSKNNSASSKSNKEAEEQPLSSTDYQLYEALNLLKGLAIYNKK
ncbi:MAG: S41 family peptidase [Gammaproteobacteria bacterium]|nr:S41 family peptidase [Gammaproteobacteria bacterium]